jgi:hypothetical protein
MYKYARSTHKYLGKIDHPIGGLRQPNTGKPKVTFDIEAMTGTAQPAIDHFPRSHRPGSHIFRRYMEPPQVSADLVDPLPETVMPEGTFTRQHIPAVNKRYG